MDYYKEDHAGTGALLRSAGMAAVTKAAAEDGARFAASISPVLTGAYRDAFRVETGTEVVSGDSRAVARIVNDSDYAAAVEVDHRVLSRTVDYIETL